MTFSVVARDPGSGSFGVAIATARPSVGARSAFVTAGVGACATQAIVNPALAGAALAGLAGAAGGDADAALRAALADDPDAARRQVLLAGPDGTAAHTGDEVAGWNGHLVEPDVAVGGNLLADGEPLPAMLAAFHVCPGDLADRLLAALAAGDAAGGDSRGRESAALLVVDDRPWPAVDLRIDHDADPVGALGRLLTRWRTHWTAYDETGVFVPADPPGAVR
ncbi:DUF1028 domain-containing protein [Nocardioides sp. LHD-245]|uniref:DUF1028 domain-containing protein n=1 Tax=Nocardioides sp. LHD-245 TaxID=3051387 RepID=UPI0027E1546D|nr:DUF1028 domain-containing protein [Nocardioides sp. LHD-245]